MADFPPAKTPCGNFPAGFRPFSLSTASLSCLHKNLRAYEKEAYFFFELFKAKNSLSSALLLGGFESEAMR
jgi:hypothetical protein